MNFSAWSIRNPIPAIMLFFMLTVAGLYSFKQMRVQNMPDLDLPMVTISASLPGATPGQLENDVARKIENALVNIQGIKHIYTSLSDGTVAMNAEFRLEKPIQEALDEVRSAVQGVRSDLPTELPDPIVDKVDLSSVPLLAFALNSSKMDAQSLSWFIDHELTRRLLAIPGVGNVMRVGGVKRQINVDLTLPKLRSLGMTVADVSRQLRADQVESGGGEARLSGGEQPFRVMARAASADALANVHLTTPGGARVRLGDIAAVSDGVADLSTAAWLDGKETIGFEVARSKGASETELGQQVRETVRQLEKERPDLKFVESLDMVTTIEEEYGASMNLLYEGAFLAVVVVWLFLRDWRSTLVAAVALPMSVIPTFIGMYLWGFSINGVTLLALSLVVGILVDDAIVEIENIVRHLRMGKTPYEAAMEAADEIGLAVIATTFALISVFLPTAFMSGIIGMFFQQFGWTAALAVFASLVVARLLTPMMAAYMLKPMVDAEREPRWLSLYMRGARWVMHHRLQTMIYAVLFFVGSVMMAGLLTSSFIPPDDNDQTQVKLTLAPGSTLQQTADAAEDARQRLAKVAHVKQLYTTIGGSSSDPFASRSGGTNMATITVKFSPRAERPKKYVIEQSMREALKTLPGVRVEMGFGNSGAKYTLVLSGHDSVRLDQASRAVEQELRSISGIGGITSSAGLVRREIIVRPDKARAASLGVTPSAIVEALRVSTQGDYDQSLPKMNFDERQVAIVARLEPGARENLDALKRIPVQGSKGVVMLDEVADLDVGGGPSVISRYDRARNVNFDIELAEKPLGDVMTEVMNLPSVKNLPEGVKVAEVGDAEMMNEMFGSFGVAMLAGILCIYVVLVLLFKQFLHPVTILSALPLAIGGSFVGLLVGRFDLSMPALIGLVMLMGIVTKNSILLVEYAIVARRDHGMTRTEALLDACHKRARPIIMTTIAMGAGMLPIIIGSASSDGSFRSPMGMAVLGGLITSTALSLLVVPAVFTYVDDVGQWFMRGWRRVTHHGQ
ncbi:MAG: efflux RND transporter permease subunit [Lautropia sp.]|nr:efflux RND transporter permease subunit [Lautropia sp.]